MGRLVAAIVRHGDYHQLPDTPSAHQPFPLTGRGEAQAGQAAAAIRTALAGHGWRLLPQIDCSNLLRAWQTARIMADRLGEALAERFEVQGFDALAERGLGSAANLAIGQIEAVVRQDPRFAPLPADWKANSEFRLPLQGAESLLEAGQRVADHMLRRMAALWDPDAPDRLKLFVGHGAAFRHAAYRLGVLSYADIARLSMHHADPVYLEYDDGEWRHVAGAWKVRGRQEAQLD